MITAATTVDASAPIGPVLLSLAAFVALYVWTALALSAVLRKAGEEGWKAWVPVLNVVILLQLGGLSGWLVLLALVPIAGLLALWVVQVIACYRINVAFGYGAGMTVLAALLFPVWATVVGFGAARWLGAEAETVPGARRSSAVPPDGATAYRGAATTSASPVAPGASGADPVPPPPTPPAPSSDATIPGGWAPVPPASFEPAAPAPPVPPLRRAAAARSDADPQEPISFVPLLPSAPAAAQPEASAPAVPPVPPAPFTPAPQPDGDVLAAPSAPAPASAARANQGWGGFDLGAVNELTSEVTAAVAGAPSPVSAVPRDDAAPAVTRVPPTRPAPTREPWSPARSPFPEQGAFPEASGEVSAVVGAPDAGIPRAARSSVSAQHVRPEIPEDEIDHTVISHRRRAHWSLVLPTGSEVELVADTVLVGRRPAPSTAYPDAQLVEVHDGTVSKTHLRLERDGEHWSVIDLHSTNGTILVAPDGAEREIAPGAPHRAAARLLLGDAELRLTPDDASR
ncbi:DUF5684 domain-containing protein [Microbacterium insulae]|uniref:DUF5684 domain-containing protein n=1 Tax=Microbacterium insulae TaxID=483014 RepID=A0ABW3AIR0_9MICO